MQTSPEKTLICPICDCEISVSGDEKPGTEIFCVFCDSPLKFREDREGNVFLKDDF